MITPPGMVEGNIDRVDHKVLQLWCMDLSAPDKPVLVDVLINNHVLGRFVANEYRPDLEAAGKGAGLHGLTVDFSGSPMTADDAPLVITACAADAPGQPFATIELRPRISDNFNLSPSLVAHLRHQFPRLVDELHERSRRGWGIADAQSFADRVSAPIVEPTTRSSRIAVSKYGDYTRYRMRADEQFDVHRSSLETDNFFKWYLTSYSRERAEQRAPLSAPELAYLNELIIFGGQRYHLSRITWVFLLDDPEQVRQLNLNNADSYIQVIYWWAILRSRELWVEDCLVNSSYVVALSEVANRWRALKYPLSRFMELHFNGRIEWHFLNLEFEQDRCIYYALLMLDVARQPALLRYLPRNWVGTMLRERAGGQAPLEMLVRQAIDVAPGLREVVDYERVIKALGFDLVSARSTTITAEGHRVANLGLRTEHALLSPVSVQVIGPLHKASGLGQATRLSYDALKRHFPDCSAYDFDLDNPAPVGFNAKRLSSPLRHAKVNLIHLNAESIPLVFAYLPDVFTNAYNIGYFFWELDTPAACHMLALELLDEVWVSSSYGVQQYRPVTKIPVTKISMSYEDLAIPARSDARAYVQARLGYRPDCFVFFAAFDSFSFIQRKNPHAVVAAFREAFPNDPNVRLILKTHNRDFVYDPVQRKIWQLLDEAVQTDPRIAIINETLPYEQLLLLKAGCDCYVSLHRSEGWGFGMIEAMHLGVAVLATGYSGNMEFCSPETAWIVDYKLRPVAATDYIFVTPGQVWAEPDHADAVRQMQAIVADPGQRRERTARAKAFVDQGFSPTVVAGRYAQRLEQVMSAVGRPQPPGRGTS